MKANHLGAPNFVCLLGAISLAISLASPAIMVDKAMALADEPPMPDRDTFALVPDGAQTVCPGSGVLEGVDVSKWQGTISWTQVAKAGKVFAYARIADGLTYIDNTFLTNYAGIKKAGMKAGAYFFYEPDEDPLQQANLIISKLGEAGFGPGDLLPVIDVETTAGQSKATVVANLQTTINRISETLHVIPIIYTAPYWWNSNVSSTAFSSSPLWVANWYVTCPSIPMGWSTWVLWQYSSTGSVPGISTAVDLDRSFGSTLPIYLVRKTYLPIVLTSAG